MNITAGADRAAHIGVKEMILGTNEGHHAMSARLIHFHGF